MSSNRFLLLLVTTSLYVVATGLLTPNLAAQPPRSAPDLTRELSRPNVIIMMADDMGMGDTSAYQDITGNSDEVQVKTPAMEQLARMGIRFTDAHAPSSRCTATRQALLTGRYTWRTRLKYSVLWSPAGDPLIEPTRPTLATLLKEHGYGTGMTGKWHCGLTYRTANGQPTSDYSQVELKQGIADGPLQHGFDFFHGTSRSHPTSDLQGWLFGDRVVAAIGGQKVDESQYVLDQTGPKNYEMAMQFLDGHLASNDASEKPFFLYYACHSNHLSHDPCVEIAGRPVRGASQPGGKRSDFIFENDVALGLLLEFLQRTPDPRTAGAKLIENTLVIFTSDNGAETPKKTATGPFRSNKASIYEGGHRVPFIATWPAGGIGDGKPNTPGQTSQFPICHVDLFATLAEIVGASLDERAAEDSFSILAALRGNPPSQRTPILHNDHKEGTGSKPENSPEAAWLAIRIDNPVVAGNKVSGQWKLFIDHHLLMGDEQVNVKELYELASDPQEKSNRINDPQLQELVQHMAHEVRSIHDRGGIPKQATPN
jgi:arylsulfatase A-like enzyme